MGALGIRFDVNLGCHGAVYSECLKLDSSLAVPYIDSLHISGIWPGDLQHPYNGCPQLHQLPVATSQHRRQLICGHWPVHKAEVHWSEQPPISETSTIKYLKITLGPLEPDSDVSHYYNRIGALATYLLAIGGRHCEYDLELDLCSYATGEKETTADFLDAMLRGTLRNMIARRIAESFKPAGWRKSIKVAQGKQGASGATIR